MHGHHRRIAWLQAVFLADIADEVETCRRETVVERALQRLVQAPALAQGLAQYSGCSVLHRLIGSEATNTR